METPLRHYESSCHSKTQQNTHPKYTKYMHTVVLYICCVTHLLCDLSSWNPCSAFDVPRPRCVLELAQLWPTKLAILGRWIPGSQILNLRITVPRILISISGPCASLHFPTRHSPPPRILASLLWGASASGGGVFWINPDCLMLYV